MKLFDQPKVTKFFDILHKLERSVDEKYGKDCAKQIFVKRTISKWLKGKKLILYKTEESLNIEYKQYVQISNLEYALSWSDELRIYVYDYSRPYNLYTSIKLSHNDILRLEGDWNTEESIFTQLLGIFTLDIPEKEYIYQTYDFDKYPKRVKNKEEALQKIKSTISFFAKTEKEADLKKQKFQKENTSKLYIEKLIKIV